MVNQEYTSVSDRQGKSYRVWGFDGMKQVPTHMENFKNKVGGRGIERELVS